MGIKSKQNKIISYVNPTITALKLPDTKDLRTKDKRCQAN